MREDESIVTYCGTCREPQYHVAAEHHAREASEYEANRVHPDYLLEYDLLICQTCHAAKLRTVESLEQLDARHERCKRPHPKRSLPDWDDDLPDPMAALLRDTHDALTQKCSWLVAMGNRSQIDMYAIFQGGDIGCFAKKIEKMLEKGLITATDKAISDAAVVLGHEAMNRERLPSRAHIEAATGVAANLIARLVRAKRAVDNQSTFKRAPTQSTLEREMQARKNPFQEA